MVQSLNRKWKEFLFAFSGFGPNFLMVLMGAYFSDAVNPAAMGLDTRFQTIMEGTCFILPALFPILFAISKVFDGLIDIPFAHITDTLSTKWGRRRPAIAVCMVPMIISFVLCWIPIGGASTDAQLINTIWIAAWSLVFFATYTMCLIAFYGSLSTVCTDEPQRLRVSGYKSFFDTISYCIVYALVPVILDGMQIHIDDFVFLCTPLMLSMAIPLFLIKEGEKYGYPENRGAEPQKITMKESILLTFKNRIFRRWLLVNSCTFFGMQMFLSAMNGLIIGGMGMNGLQMAILNTAAFGPVPVMLYLFNKAKARHGVRATYQSCLISFAIAIFAFLLGSNLVWGPENDTIKMTIGIVGSLCGSWSIGVFFMMPYLAPAQISSVEERLTGKNHSAMYFAGNSVTSAIVGAISGNLVYEYIKNLFFAKGQGIQWVEATETLSAAEHANQIFGEASYNFGNTLVPFIVAACCLLGFALAFKLPKDFTPTILANEFKNMDPSLDISGIEEEEAKPERGEIIFVQVGLSILSFFVFGFIWVGLLAKSIKEYAKNIKPVVIFLLSCLIPFGSVYCVLKMRKAILGIAAEKGKAMKMNVAVLIITTLIFPILPLNVVALSMLQHGMNKVYTIED